ncbi:putative ABC transport system permease protein [Paenibacillus phyllosphaerae]|uniref:Putative hemin transport system permease protein HrtB n=1 Tax=Paenibacillus phyllosphaerae TaxID=274593 RepID=A0A7W5B524_9BACL|nr:ABC transporter permease [Paenibacillus phyllosphaerae]MBB3114076.1 putative ABC transport system permease protein [Paenibacillus phyllosphaerae]
MYLAIREMRFVKVRYSLISIIMLLVAFLVLFVTGLARGLAYDNAASIQNMDATHFIMEKDSNHRFTRSQISEQVLLQASSIVGEDDVQPLGVKMTTMTAEGKIGKLDVTLLGINPEGWLMPKLTEGAAITATGTGQVLVDRKLKDSGIGLGTVLIDQASGLKWTVSGFVNHESFSHSPAVFLNEHDWQQLQLTTITRTSSATKWTDSTYNAVAVKANTHQKEQLTAVLADAEIVTKADAVSAIPGYKEEQGSLWMMIIFLFIISSFVLAVFFYVITIQKSSQFGILKAIGTRTGYLVRSVALQVLLLSAGSLVVSMLLIQVTESILPSGMPFLLQSSTIALTSSAFVIMSLAGSLLSVWKVTKIEALDAIGRTAA